MIRSQKKINITSLLITTLSAVAFSSAFLWNENFSWLILVWYAQLVVLFYFVGEQRVALHVLRGFWWGLVAYAMHFGWSLQLFLYKSNATIAFAVMLYLSIVVYAALTSSLWFLVIGKCSAWLCVKIGRWRGSFVAVTTITSLYFFILDRGMFWFLGCGYPFLNPIIPLMAYRPVVLFLWTLGGGGGQSMIKPVFFTDRVGAEVQVQNGDRCMCLAVRPSSENKHILHAAIEIGEEIGRMHPQGWADNYSATCFWGPESTLSFVMKENPAMIEICADRLPRGGNFIFGGLGVDVSGSEQIHQTVYWAQAGLIIKHYDKKHCIPCFETVPPILKSYSWANNLFLKGKTSFVPGNEQRGRRIFLIAHEFPFAPFICSEIFFWNTAFINHEVGNRDICIVALINDSWFPDYFKKNMVRAAQLKACLLGRLVLYVRHAKDLSILPFFVTV